MNVKSVVKKAIVYFYIDTDEVEFPRYRRSEMGNWERLMGDSWEPWDVEVGGDLERSFQEYMAGQPKFNLNPAIYHRIDDGIYHIEYVDADHVRLTKKADS